MASKSRDEKPKRDDKPKRGEKPKSEETFSRADKDKIREVGKAIRRKTQRDQGFRDKKDDNPGKGGKTN